MGKRERRLWRKMLEDPGPRSPAPPRSSKGAPYGARKVRTEKGTRREKKGEAPSPRGSREHLCGLRNVPT